MCYRELQNKRQTELHITADKREIQDFPKLPLATSFIRKTLSLGWDKWWRSCKA